MTPGGQGRRRLVGLLVRCAIAVVLLWLVVSGIEFDGLAARVSDIDAVATLAGLAVLMLVPVMGGARWRRVTRSLGGALAVWPAIRMFWIGALFGQVLPASIGGDAVRVWLAWRAGHGGRVAINSVLIERLVLLIVLVLMAAASLPFVAARIGIAMPVGVVWLLAAAALAAPLAMAFADRLPGVPGSARWLQPLGLLAGDLRRFACAGADAVAAVVNSLVNHLVVIVAAWLFVAALSLPLTFIDCLVLMPLVLLLSSLPISFAGWGVREGAMVYLFGAASGDAAGALMVSVLIGLASIASCLPALPMWLALPERTPAMPGAAAMTAADDKTGGSVG